MSAQTADFKYYLYASNGITKISTGRVGVHALEGLYVMVQRVLQLSGYFRGRSVEGSPSNYIRQTRFESGMFLSFSSLDLAY